MSDYRLYCLDGSGRFNKSHEIRAANDGEALARKMKLPVKCELWDKARMVAELPPGAS
jgi:hypothetical protein